MSEEKLYAVKNDEGEWSDGTGAFYPEKKNGMGFIFTMFSDRDEATGWAERNTNGGHVVTLVEEPEKVVLSEKQAEIVEGARIGESPATYICARGALDDEKLLIQAYVNGYTVAKEKKYYVKVPLVQAQGGLWFFINSEDKLDATYLQELAKKFTMDEIEENGLQDCEKEEVTDDE
jgi:phosphosulfolactate phosphohydrolase-like enzyme